MPHVRAIDTLPYSASQLLDQSEIRYAAPIHPYRTTSLTERMALPIVVHIVIHLMDSVVVARAPCSSEIFSAVAGHVYKHAVSTSPGHDSMHSMSEMHVRKAMKTAIVMVVEDDDARLSHATTPTENRASVVDAFRNTFNTLISTIPLSNPCILHCSPAIRMSCFVNVPNLV